MSLFVNVNVKVPDTRAGWLLHWADYFSPPKVKSTILKIYYDIFANVESHEVIQKKFDLYICVIWMYHVALLNTEYTWKLWASHFFSGHQNLDDPFF